MADENEPRDTMPPSMSAAVDEIKADIAERIDGLKTDMAAAVKDSEILIGKRLDELMAFVAKAHGTLENSLTDKLSEHVEENIKGVNLRHDDLRKLVMSVETRVGSIEGRLAGNGAGTNAEE